MPVEAGIDLRVRAMERLADGILSLTLEHPDGGDLPPWSAGAHVDLVFEGIGCRRRSKSEPPCRPNIEPGVGAGLQRAGGG